MNLKPAQEFLTRCFAPEETIALLLRSEATAMVTQRIVTVRQAIASRYLGWLTYENANGANIYVAANGVARSEWMRDAILRELRPAPASNNASLAEVLGIRLLLVNVLRPLAAGHKLTPEAFDKLLDEISTAKHDLAGKLMSEQRS